MPKGLYRQNNDPIVGPEVRVRYFDDFELDVPVLLYCSMINRPPLDELPWKGKPCVDAVPALRKKPRH